MDKELLQALRMASSKVIHATINRGQIVACDDRDGVRYLANAAIYAATPHDTTARDYVGVYESSKVFIVDVIDQERHDAAMLAVAVGETLDYSAVKYIRQRHNDPALDLSNCPVGSAVFVCCGRLAGTPEYWKQIVRERDLILVLAADNELTDLVEFDQEFIWEDDCLISRPFLAGAPVD